MADLRSEQRSGVNGAVGGADADWPYSRFTALASGIVLVGLLVLSCLNVLTDPFRAFRVVNLPMLEGRRQAVGETRTGKAEILMQTRPHTVLLGTSRTDIGIDPALAAWGSVSVVNLGLGGAGMAETFEIYQAAVRAGGVRRVVLFADFSAFNARRGPAADFSRSLFNPRTQPVNYALSNLFSQFASENSLETLRRAFARTPSQYDQNGFRTGHRPAGSSYRARFRQTIWGATRNPDGYRNFLYGRKTLELVRLMAEQSRERGISLSIVIPPFHALGLETIRAAGLWPTFCGWKRELLGAVARRHEGDMAVPVWDFADYARVVREAIPKDDAHDVSLSPMKWFWESSHFTRALGERIVARITAPSTSSLDETLGAELTPATFEAHLRRIEREREDYAAAMPDEIAFVEEITKRALSSSRAGR